MDSILPQLSKGSALLLAPIAILTYVIVLSIYRRTLHPLAKYPGPFWSSLTAWTTVWETTTGDRHLDQLRQHEKYGSVVRIGPNMLSFNTLSAIREIYSNRKGNVQKAQWYAIIDASSGDYSTHSEIDKNIHASRRRVLEHAFSEKALRSAETFITQNVHSFCEIIMNKPKKAGGRDEKDGKWSEPMNMSEWSTYLNYDIMGDLVFGKKFDCMTSSEHRFVPALLMNGTAFLYTLAYFPLGLILRPILASGILNHIGGQMAKDEKLFFKYASDRMTERIEAEEKLKDADDLTARKDFMHYLLRATDPQTGKGFTRAQLDAESSLLISAGGDTTSTTLAAAFFYLLHNPRVLEVLVEEIRSTFTSTDDIAAGPGTKLSGLVYLKAVIDETLRLAPPAPTHLPREVLAGGLVVDGVYIPEGTVVGVPAYAIHRNPEYYPEPRTFCPERWIVEDEAKMGSTTDLSIPRTNEAVQTARHAFTAFSHGTRGCVGRQLAYYELQTALAIILYQFDIRLARDEESGKLLRNSTAWRENVMPVMDPEDQQEDWRDERKRRDDFQLFDRFLGDRSGPMVEFMARSRA